MANLRIKDIPRGAAVTITVNGRSVRAYGGESVQAALVAGGFLAVGKSKSLNAPRGIFCGMGVCYECLVTINGVPNQRACMCLLEPDMEIVLDDGDL